MTNVLISAAGLCGATIIGAILGFFVKELPHKWNDAVLGYCAGIMLAASTLGLIVPAFEQTRLWWLVVIGVMAGALFLNVLDQVTPHLHHITGLDPEEHRNNARLSHVMLFVMAIALHKLPEGMAAGVSVCSSEGATEWGVSFIFIALLEVVGILLGFGLGSASTTFLPVMLGFAGGAMLYVTSDEMIPETHAHGFQKQATYALLLGFITFVLMEKCV